MTEPLAKLNCAVGDLAITVNCKLVQNLGNIVRVKSAIGMMEWGAGEDLLFSWEVDIATEHGFLTYDYEGDIVTAKSGPVPGKYLRRITPPQGYLMEEFADSEQLQMDLLEIESIESENNV